MKVKAPRGYHFMKKKGKFKLMKNPKVDIKNTRVLLTMDVPVVKRHSNVTTSTGNFIPKRLFEYVRSLLNRS